MLLIVEGNICAGKSTFIKRLCEWGKQKDVLINFIDEPHEVWQNFLDKNGQDALTAYYNDIPNNAVSFQLLTFTARLAELNKKYMPCMLNVVERTPITTLVIFGKLLVDDCHITEQQHSVFLKLGEDLIPSFLNTKKIFIDTAAGECYQRSILRDKIPVPIDYLQKLDKAYRENIIFCEDKNCMLRCNNFHKCDGTGKELFSFENLFIE